MNEALNGILFYFNFSEMSQKRLYVPSKNETGDPSPRNRSGGRWHCPCQLLPLLSALRLWFPFISTQISPYNPAGLWCFVYSSQQVHS